MKRYGLTCLVVFFLLGLLAPLASAEGQPCKPVQVFKKFWCDTCKLVSEFPDCKNQQYVWDWEKHKGEKNPHMNLPYCWACQKSGFVCIKCGKCYNKAQLLKLGGVCEDDGDDTQSQKDLAKVVFKCPDGHSFDEPGTGHTLVAGAYEEQIEKPGNCPTCGKPLKTECTKSGSCPHQG